MRHTIPTWSPSEGVSSPAAQGRYHGSTTASRSSGFTEPTPTAARAPAKIGCYRLVHQIGEGGCSRIYVAQQLDSGRKVAVKIPKEESCAVGSRIKQEFRAARRLDHPHIVRMHRLLPIGDRFAAVMEWLGGPCLMEYVRGSLPHGALPPLPRLKFIAAQLAAALAHIHASGWVHGDIKPDNVHFTGSGVPRWIDFGLATRSDRPTWMPRPENLVGTFAYLPPESILGDPLTPASDMFSFGRLLLKLVCGRLPSWDPDMGADASAARIRHQLPSGTPAALADVCIRLVRLSPTDRPSAAEVYKILTTEPLPSVPGSPREQAPRAVRTAACEAMRRADDGWGTLLLVESDQPERMDLEPLMTAIRSEEPRLVLSGCCDSGEWTPLPAFDAILDQLAEWAQQVPAGLRDDWRQCSGDALAWASPELAAALEIPCSGGAGLAASPEAACDALASLFAKIAAQRTVVLTIRGIDRVDAHSGRLLSRLVGQMQSAPIVVIATARRQSPAWRPAVMTPPLSPVVSRVRF